MKSDAHGARCWSASSTSLLNTQLSPLIGPVGVDEVLIIARHTCLESVSELLPQSSGAAAAAVCHSCCLVQLTCSCWWWTYWLYGLSPAHHSLAHLPSHFTRWCLDLSHCTPAHPKCLNPYLVYSRASCVAVGLLLRSVLCP